MHMIISKKLDLVSCLLKCLQFGW